MKLNNKGFAVSAFMYMLLVLAIILILATLAVLSSRQMILDKQKTIALENITNKYKPICKSVNGVRSLALGTKYECEVKPGTKYYFYIIYVKGTKINLIMDRNICSDGTTEYTNSNDYCRQHWYETSYTNNYGPVTAMTYLYEGTKSWTNVPDMIVRYYDEKNNNTTKGYTSIITNNKTKVTTITGKNGATNTEIGTSLLPLKARLPKLSELEGVGCSESFETCPAWVVENMRYYFIAGDNYSVNSSNTLGTAKYNIIGYWTLSSKQDDAREVYYVRYSGIIGDNDTKGLTSSFGVRPVITITKNMLIS